MTEHKEVVGHSSTSILDLPQMNPNWGGTSTPVGGGVNAYAEQIKTLTCELSEAKIEIEHLKSELNSSKSNSKYYSDQRDKYAKEIEDLHKLLNTFKNSMGKEGDNSFDRVSLSIRLTSLLTKEFTWRGDYD